jgi:DNA primase
MTQVKRVLVVAGKQGKEFERATRRDYTHAVVVNYRNMKKECALTYHSNLQDAEKTRDALQEIDTRSLTIENESIEKLGAEFTVYSVIEKPMATI